MFLKKPLLALTAVGLAVGSYAQFNGTPIDWNTNDGLSVMSSFTGNDIRWITIDMNGDEKPDLMYTYENGFLNNGNEFTWDVYLNNGNGFDATATEWTLPNSGLAVTTSTTGNDLRWNLIDMDGDKKPDLVYTYDDGFMFQGNQAVWEVYLNNGAGFDVNPISWNLPTSALAVMDNYVGTTIRWRTMDMNGDGKPDLLYTYDNGFINNGTSYNWEVYLNNGSGFDANPIEWLLPNTGLAVSDEFTGTTIRWRTIDITGDKLPDLVYTYDNGGISVGSQFVWEVYENNGNGFDSSPINWNIPDGLLVMDSFTGDLRWSTVDMNGDQKLDLVYTYDDGVITYGGVPAWEVYFNEDDGFDSSPFVWTTPDGLETTSQWTGTDIRWSISDMNGDGSIDLVYTYDNGFIDNGTDFTWEVYLNEQVQVVDDTTDTTSTSINLTVANQQELRVFPNPATSEVMHQFAQELNNATFTVMDPRGQLIEQRAGLNGRMFRFELDAYPAGVYFYQWMDGKSTYSGKFVKQ